MMPAKKNKNSDHLMKLPTSEVNQIIKEKLNAVIEDKKIIDLAGKMMWEQTQALRFIKTFSELAARRLNLPTKDDVANVAKLTIQVEEKIDSLEEKVSILADQLQDRNETASDAVEEATDYHTDVDANANHEKRDSSPMESPPADNEQKRPSHTDLLKQLQTDLILHAIHHHAQDLPELADFLTLRRKAEKQ